MKRRRKILEKVMVEIPNRIVLSEQEEIHVSQPRRSLYDSLYDIQSSLPLSVPAVPR